MERLNLLKSKIGMKLVRVGKLSRALAIQKFTAHKYKITPEQFTVLASLIENDGMYQRQIANITLKDRPNITRIINILENMKLVKRQADVEKRKIYKIFITDEGRKVYEEVLPTVLDLWQLSVNGVDDEELEICLKTLDKFKDNLDREVNIQM